MAPNQHDHHHDHYDAQTYAGDEATQAQRGQQHMPAEDRSSRSEIQADIAGDQSAQLAPQVRMGDDRAIGSAPNWEGMTSTQLHAAATQNNSPNTADNLGRAFNEGGNRLADAANRLLAAVSKLDAVWTGHASDSARGALTPLAESAGQAGLAAQLMGAQMARQTAAASEVRKLPPPEEFDYQAELQTALANPNPVAGMADMKAKKDKADAVKREQVAYLTSYTQSMSAVDSQTPSFIEPPKQISGGGGGQSNITGGSVNYVGPGGAGRLDRPPNQSTSPGPGGGWSGSSPGIVPPSGDGTDGQDFGPLPNLGGIGTGSSGYVPTPSTVPNLPGGGPGGGLHSSVPGAGQGGFGGGFGSFGGAGGGGGASGGAAQAGTGGTSGGSGARGLGAGGAPGGPGEHAGSAGRGGAGGAGRGGPGGSGTGAGARKEEDDEHERPSYLVEADPDATFGTDEVTAPPVIGGDGPE